MTQEFDSGITVVAIALNEASRIENFVIEWRKVGSVVVVDSGSDDNTMQLAAGLGARVERRPWTGFGDQKQFAVSLSPTDWVVSADVDELPCGRLIMAIKNAALDDGSIAYSFLRKNFFLGKRVKFSGWGSDTVIRVFDKTRCAFLPLKVHESVKGYSRVVNLEGFVTHHPYSSEVDIESKIDRYSKLGANDLIMKGTSVPFLKPYMSSGWAFIRTLILKGGVFDGLVGFRIALMNASVSWRKYHIARSVLRRSSE